MADCKAFPARFSMSLPRVSLVSPAAAFGGSLAVGFRAGCFIISCRNWLAPAASAVSVREAGLPAVCEFFVLVPDAGWPVLHAEARFPVRNDCNGRFLKSARYIASDIRKRAIIRRIDSREV
jgi:hypothetical protein